ncbi:MAG: hypothetical protein P0119_20680 [Nitrospira sp.]|nr:hypothetical protein [Nitrospira sp.]
MKQLDEAYGCPTLMVLWSVLTLFFPVSLYAVETLPPYNADLSQTSLSGVSSGGYMAVQFHVAYSSMIKGVGIIAGGPYNCAEDSVWRATHNCMDPDSSYPLPDLNHLIATTDELVRSRDVDDSVHLKNARVWLFSGTNDTIIHQPVMDALNRYYEHYVDPADIEYNNNLRAGHGMIVEDSTANACPTSESPYINNCSYSAAEHLLKHIYGSLNPPSRELSGTFVEFDQTEFLGGDAYSHGMRDSGFAYLPRSCASTRCRVHVAFHGCLQHYDAIGDRFYKKGGYNEWADSNDIIVVYPQTIARFGWNWKTFWTLGYIFNPNACWDWWGYDDSDYYKKSGNQIVAVKGMLARLASPGR